MREPSDSTQLRSSRVKPLPKKSSIPVPLFYASSNDGTDENLLILSHDLGSLTSHFVFMPDSFLSARRHTPAFTKVGRQPPQTAVLTLRAPEQ